MIDVQDLTKHYGDRVALDGVSFSVPPGQVLGFLGPNGAGKSTTMRILTGYLGATSGRAAVAGRDVFKDSLEVRRRVGYLPENNPLYDDMRVENHLHLGARLRGLSGRKRRERVEAALETCGLADRRRDVVGRLSRGLRQRVGLALAVLHEPEVLILDEPTAGLDPMQTRETRELIRGLRGRHTVVLSSHILPEVSAVCDRVLIVNRGRIAADDAPDNLSRRFSEEQGVDVDLLVHGDRDRLAGALAGIPGLAVGPVEEVGGDLRLRVHGADGDPREEIARAVVGAGLGLLEMRAHRVTLEDVFIHLVTEEGGSWQG